MTELLEIVVSNLMLKMAKRNGKHVLKATEAAIMPETVPTVKSSIPTIVRRSRRRMGWDGKTGEKRLFEVQTAEFSTGEVQTV